MSASVALDAPLSREPVIEALRSLAPRSDHPSRSDADTARSGFDVRREFAATEAVAAPAAEQRREPTATGGIDWVEPADNLWLLALKNYGLSLATFGVYHFWGRVEMNRRMINAVRIGGRQLDFTGSGREAFVSFSLGSIVATVIVAAFVFVFVAGGGTDQGVTVEGIRQFRWQRLTISLPMLFLFGSIAYRKRHHILRRTWIGAERFGLTGHAWSYAWRHFWTAFLVPLTIGWAAPWRSAMLEARKIGEMQHGPIRFHAVGNMAGLYRAFALIWLVGGLLYVGTLVALGVLIGPELMAAINGMTLAPLKSEAVLATAGKVLAVAVLPAILVSMLWRKAWVEYQISAIGFDGGRLHLAMPVGRYLKLALSGLALSLVSLGCFRPVARTRMLRFIVEHVRVEGRLPL